MQIRLYIEAETKTITQKYRMMKFTVSKKTKDKLGRNEWITLKHFSSKSKALSFARKQSKKQIECDVMGFDADHELIFHCFVSNGKINNMGL